MENSMSGMSKCNDFQYFFPQNMANFVQSEDFNKLNNVVWKKISDTFNKLSLKFLIN
jgi:hypothetical protein